MEVLEQVKTFEFHIFIELKNEFSRIFLPKLQSKNLRKTQNYAVCQLTIG